MGLARAAPPRPPAPHQAWRRNGPLRRCKFVQLLGGDVISTGTPGAAVIGEGDVAECRISGFEPLSNPSSGSSVQRYQTGMEHHIRRPTAGSGCSPSVAEKQGSAGRCQLVLCSGRCVS